MDPLTGTVTILFTAALLSFLTILAMDILELNASNVVASAIVTWGIWILFWRSEVELPSALAGHLADVQAVHPWWLLWTLGYFAFFAIWHRIWFKE